ncbi:MAG TPA: hypothetical protein VMT53_23400 [Terriglobales bacterium]|nr:hypothetical protein [Terriglobales bacterium]
MSEARTPRSTTHRFIHYGSGEPETVRTESLVGGATAAHPVAVLVCHGMGQQVRYETIAAFAECIREEVLKQGCTAEPVDVHLCQVDDDFRARAELRWRKDGEPHEVHVYEAYWAPLTEGKVSYWDTIKFLLRAGAYGLRWSKPFMRSTFKRWMFGGPRDLPIGRTTWIALVVVLAFLLLQVGVIAYVSLALAQQWKAALSPSFPVVNGFWPWLVACGHWLAALIPGIEYVRAGRSWFWIVLWVGLLAEALLVRYFVVEFVGDVAAYISPYKNSKFDDLRHEIRKIGLDVGKVIYGFGKKQPAIPDYEKVIIAGHSLGSVVAYDTLNSLIAADEVCTDAARRHVVRRTRALITFGSPLDKTAFIFRNQAGTEQEWIREKLAAAVQPLIVSYPDYRPEWFEWVNIWSPMDIISGSLEYYDGPDVTANDPRHVKNIRDKRAWIPLFAHVQYWGNPTLGEQTYRFVSGSSQRRNTAKMP